MWFYSTIICNVFIDVCKFYVEIGITFTRTRGITSVFGVQKYVINRESFRVSNTYRYKAESRPKVLGCVARGAVWQRFVLGVDDQQGFGTLAHAASTGHYLPIPGIHIPGWCKYSIFCQKNLSFDRNLHRWARRRLTFTIARFNFSQYDII